MNCKHIRNKAVDFIEKKLPLADEIRFRRHLSECAGCREVFVKFEKLWLSSDNKLVPAVNPFLITRIEEKITTIQSQIDGSGINRQLRSVWIVAAAVAGILIGIFAGYAPEIKSGDNQQIQSDYVITGNDLQLEKLDAYLVNDNLD